jgi:3-mercaptopyruvate sulfurtransferase SseA
VLDLETSLAYEAGHIPGALFAIRSNLVDNPHVVPGDGGIVLTSSDGVLAAFTATDIGRLIDRPVQVLQGGTAAWQAAGFDVESGDGVALHPFEDLARSAYQIKGDRFAAFREYLDWELSLVAQLERDGTADFRVFPPVETAA